MGTAHVAYFDSDVTLARLLPVKDDAAVPRWILSSNALLCLGNFLLTPYHRIHAICISHNHNIEIHENFAVKTEADGLGNRF